MKDELFKQILALVFGGVLGVLFKYWYDYKGMVHKELWVKRYETYKEIFLLTGTLPLYPKKSDISYGELFTVSEKMRDWFFKEGGLLLSTKTRNKYFKVQKNIQLLLADKDNEALQKKITDEYEGVRKIFSQLRKQMTDDLMSRQRL
jgi:hypothetical protein